VSVQSRLGQACNEEAFRHFLTLERNRWRRSGRGFLLLVVRLKQRDGTMAAIEAVNAQKLFAALWRTLRATDQVGWLRDGRAVGALLPDVCDSAAAPDLCDKVRCAFLAALPAAVGARLYIRTFRFPSNRHQPR